MTTITHEQFLTISGCESSHELARKLEQIGITIAPPEPPQGMVKLAREIAERETADWPAVTNRCAKAALAALQYAVQVVRDAPTVPGNLHHNSGKYCYRSDILRKLGATA